VTAVTLWRGGVNRHTLLPSACGARPTHADTGWSRQARGTAGAQMCRVNYARACRSPDFCTTQDSCPKPETALHYVTAQWPGLRYILWKWFLCGWGRVLSLECSSCAALLAWRTRRPRKVAESWSSGKKNARMRAHARARAFASKNTLL